MTTEIRSYQDSDRPRLVTLTEELQDFLVQMDPLKRLLRGSEYGEWYTARLLAKVARQSGQIYVASAEGTIVGYIAGVIDTESPDIGVGYIPTKAGRITELIVTSSLRASGIGSQLMTAMESFFIEAECDLIRVEVFAPNTDAKRFYARRRYSCRTHDLVRVL